MTEITHVICIKNKVNAKVYDDVPKDRRVQPKAAEG